MEIDRVRDCPSSFFSVHQTTPRDCIHVTHNIREGFSRSVIYILETSIISILSIVIQRDIIRITAGTAVDKGGVEEVVEVLEVRPRNWRGTERGASTREEEEEEEAGEGERWLVIDAQHQLVKPPCVELL